MPLPSDFSIIFLALAVFAGVLVFADDTLVFAVEDVPAVFDVFAADVLVFAGALVFAVDESPAGVADFFAADVLALVFGVFSMAGVSVIASEDSDFLSGEIVITVTED